jgi:hypothetical protein
MTREEHLEKIVAKCRELISADAGSKRAEAGWRATIAACEKSLEVIHFFKGCQELHPLHQRELETAESFAASILAVWPVELLS